MTVRFIKKRIYFLKMKLFNSDFFLSNKKLAEKFESAGFSDVSVSGNLWDRQIKSKWTKENEWVELPVNIYSVEEI